MAGDLRYYSVLGVAASADQVVIRAAFKALMLKYHPDTSSLPDANQRALEINEAFAVLGDPRRRAVYDGQLRAAKSSRASTSETGQSSSAPPPPRPPSPPKSKAKEPFGKRSGAATSPKVFDTAVAKKARQHSIGVFFLTIFGVFFFSALINGLNAPKVTTVPVVFQTPSASSPWSVGNDPLQRDKFIAKDSKGRLVDEQGRFVDVDGRRVDDRGYSIRLERTPRAERSPIVDAFGRPFVREGHLVNANGDLIDQTGNPIK